MTILVVLELDRDEVVASSLEVVGVARQLADELSCPVRGVELPADATPSMAGAGLARLVSELEPVAVIAEATDYGMEVMAHLAAHAGLPLANNCTAADRSRTTTAAPSEWTVTRVRGGGVLLEEAELVATTALITLAPGSVPPADLADLPEQFELPAPGAECVGATLVERTTAGGGVTLANAPAVVSGGRGVGSAEGFGVLEELADLLGGAVGCSRVATNNGWRPHSDQVGQTGTKVAPGLYIAAGISGATQHWAGCMNAKTILAVNTDPEAPMVTRADYAVIGDVHEVLRAVVDEINRRAAVSEVPTPTPLE